MATYIDLEILINSIRDRLKDVEAAINDLKISGAPPESLGHTLAIYGQP